MDQVELLTAIIEASVALLGFSGLVIALGRRSSGEWSPVEKLRLINLLGTGVMLLGCTLLALTLLSAGLSQDVVWALSSVGWVVIFPPYLVWALSRVSRMEKDDTITVTYRVVVGAVVAVTATIQLANAASLQDFWPFFLALAAILVLAPPSMAPALSSLLIRRDEGANAGWDSTLYPCPPEFGVEHPMRCTPALWDRGPHPTSDLS
jgi:hypothetical protein